jgi:ceramide glucosyltransferase
METLETRDVTAMSLNQFIGSIGTGVIALSAAYATLTLAAAILRRLRCKLPQAAGPPPAVSVLKPLCGAEPGLYVNLRSFFIQGCPEYQIIFGVRDAADPALAVVERLAREFPDRAIDIVINGQQHGSNRKISNLINMFTRARHDVLLISDSDVLAGRDCVATVAAPLADRTVGLVTCLYHCVPTAGIWSRLGAMYTNDWYIPSVLLACLFGHHGYASGVTLCPRRETLRDLGGLAAMADYLADDHRLGELVSALGKRVVLSPYVLQVEHDEPTLQCLVGHELRWMRTVRALRPRCFPLLCITFTVPMALLGVAIAAVVSLVSTVDLMLFTVAIVARLMLAWLPPLGPGDNTVRKFWLLPACDLLVCWAWGRAFSTSRVRWRDAEYEVDARGTLRGHG